MLNERIKIRYISCILIFLYAELSNANNISVFDELDLTIEFDYDYIDRTSYNIDGVETKVFSIEFDESNIEISFSRDDLNSKYNFSNSLFLSDLEILKSISSYGEITILEEVEIKHYHLEVEGQLVSVKKIDLDNIYVTTYQPMNKNTCDDISGFDYGVVDSIIESLIKLRRHDK